MTEKPKLMEHDAMVCRSCGNEERASEGYPCADCGTFICLICSFPGITRCKPCEEKAKPANQAKLPPGRFRISRCTPSPEAPSPLATFCTASHTPGCSAA